MSKHMNGILKNAGILMAMELGVKALDVVVSIILARYLAPQGFGLLAFAVSFASLFGVLPGFGMASLTARDLAQKPAEINRYLANGLVAKALLSFFALILIGAVAVLLGNTPQRVFIILLAAAVMALEATMRFTSAFFQAAQKMVPIAYLNLARHLGYILTALTVVGWGGGVAWILAGRILVYLIVLSFCVALIHQKLQKIRWEWDPKYALSILRASFPFALMTLFIADIDMVMLSQMRDDTMTGWYAVTYRFIAIFNFIPLSMRGVLLPAFSKSVKENAEEFSDSLTRSFHYLAMAALPLAGGIFVLSERLVDLLFGSAYSQSVASLRLLVWILPFGFWSSVLMSALASVHQEKKASVCLGIGALLDVALNWIFIPRWGHIGAAATTVFSDFTVCLLQIFFLKRNLPHLCLTRQVFRPVGATLAMMALAWFLRGSFLFIAILVPAAFYLTLLIFSRAVGATEWALLTGWIRRANPLAEEG